MAEMTNSFVGVMTDKLTELASKEKYNLLLEWGMREPESPLKTMNYLKENGYIVDVVFVATNKKDSLKACNLRGNIVNDSKHIIRQITKKFHDYCVESLPKSIDTIYNSGKEKCYDSLKIVDRYGKTLWDKSNNNQPGLIFHEYLNSGSTRDINHNFISIFDNICDE